MGDRDDSMDEVLRRMAKTSAEKLGYPSDLQDNTLEPPTLDITKRPFVYQPGGGYATVNSMGANVDGKEVLMPLVSDDGVMMTPDEAIGVYRMTGKHMGTYPDIPTSNWAGERIHENQESYAPPKPTMHVLPTQQIEGRVPEPSFWDRVFSRLKGNK